MEPEQLEKLQFETSTVQAEWFDAAEEEKPAAYARLGRLVAQLPEDMQGYVWASLYGDAIRDDDADYLAMEREAVESLPTTPANRFADNDLAFISFNGCRCNDCARVDDRGLTCTAFPQGIPEDILFDGFDHSQPLEGDQGLRFRARTEALPVLPADTQAENAD